MYEIHSAGSKYAGKEANSLKKSLMFALFVLIMALLVTGCAKTAPAPTKVPAASATAKPTASPAASPSMMPSLSPEASMEPSMQPEASPAPSDAPSYDTEALRTEVEKLSEVKSAVVAAMDGKALVGLTFDPAYQGTLTDRIVEMVGQQVTNLEKALTEVAVTADPKQVEEIEALSSDKMPDNAKFTELFEKLKPKGSNNTAK